MTKAELIKKLQDLNVPDDWEVSILMQTWFWFPDGTKATHPSEEQQDISAVNVYDEGEITIEFFYSKKKE